MTPIEHLLQLQRDPRFTKELWKFLQNYPDAGALSSDLTRFIGEYQSSNLESNRFLTFLYDNVSNRGIMADLRSSLSPTRRHAADPILARFNGIDDSCRAKAIRYVGAWFAVHPLYTHTGNIGTLCRSLLTQHESSTLDAAGEPGPLTKRFLYLLQADGDEIYSRLRSFIFRAKSEQQRVNYSQLLDDLQRWCFKADRIKEAWAQAYWTPGIKESPSEEVLQTVSQKTAA